jgi:hypothetical protein
MEWIMKLTDFCKAASKTFQREIERERERDGCCRKSSQLSTTQALCNSPETQPTPSRSS